MGLYEVTKANKEKRFNKLVRKGEKELKKCIKENIKNGNTKFTYDYNNLVAISIEEEKEIYNTLMDDFLNNPQYRDIYSLLDWHGFEKSHLRLALEIMKVTII